MQTHPFPDDPNAEVCVHTGGPANAVVGRYGRNRVTGWYGSTVIDGDTMLVLDESFPEGPISDETLKAAIADGRVFDPEPVLSGETQVRDLPDAVVAGMLRLGIDWGLRMVAREPEGGIGLPGMIHQEDDPLGSTLMDGFHRPRTKGSDLERMGVVLVAVNLARGRPFGPAEQRAAIDGILSRLAEEREFAETLRAQVGPA